MKRKPLVSVWSEDEDHMGYSREHKDVYRYRTVVVFWPKGMNAESMISEQNLSSILASLCINLSENYTSLPWCCLKSAIVGGRCFNIISKDNR